jgi:hypothetical protein
MIVCKTDAPRNRPKPILTANAIISNVIASIAVCDCRDDNEMRDSVLNKRMTFTTRNILNIGKKEILLVPRKKLLNIESKDTRSIRP